MIIYTHENEVRIATPWYPKINGHMQLEGPLYASTIKNNPPFYLLFYSLLFIAIYNSWSPLSPILCLGFESSYSIENFTKLCEINRC